MPLSVFGLRNEQAEAFNPAAATHAGPDDVPFYADPLILRLQIEASVEIECRTVLGQLGANQPAANGYQVNAVGSGKEGAPYRPRIYAFGPFDRDPFEFPWSGADRDLHDQLVLHD
ncbi:MAG TPA: hypothetical protein VM308_06885, partial [Sphingomicrobium sp.]|nr:hypothetical protein [Sphingomicrobium sp.]